MTYQELRQVFHFCITYGYREFGDFLSISSKYVFKIVALYEIPRSNLSSIKLSHHLSFYHVAHGLCIGFFSCEEGM